MPLIVDRDELRQTGLDAGLAAVGFTTADPFVETRLILEERKELGLHGGMQFTYRNPTRSTSPDRALPSVSTLVTAAYAYSAPPAQPRTMDAESVVPGRIAAYAWRDHYAELRAGLEAMALVLRDFGHDAKVLADDNALVDRAAAVRSGIGWFGKNSNVLLPGRGSWFVLGAVLTTAQIESDEPVRPRCGSCTRCFDGCPTDAIVAEGVIDARRCLAWLLQLGGMFPAEYRVALGDRIYGCDDCQEVCPPNRESPVDLRGDEVPTTDLHALLTTSDEHIMQKHGRWYIPNREARYVRRNALIAFANSVPLDHTRIASVIDTYLRHDDPMLQAHAVWAAKRLGIDPAVPAITDSTDPMVAEELRRVVEPRR